MPFTNKGPSSEGMGEGSRVTRDDEEARGSSSSSEGVPGSQLPRMVPPAASGEASEGQRREWVKIVEESFII